MIIGYVLRCDKCGWVWMSQAVPKACAKCKQRGYGGSVGEVVDDREEELREVPSVPHSGSTVTLERVPKVRKAKAVEKEPEAAEESLSDEDLEAAIEAVELADSRPRYNTVNCPKKALHSKVVVCSTCGFHA